MGGFFVKVMTTIEASSLLRSPGGARANHPPVEVWSTNQESQAGDL